MKGWQAIKLLLSRGPFLFLCVSLLPRLTSLVITGFWCSVSTRTLLTTSIALQLMALLSCFIFVERPWVLGNTRKNCHHQEEAESDLLILWLSRQYIFKSQSEPNALKILDILGGQTACTAVDGIWEKDEEKQLAAKWPFPSIFYYFVELVYWSYGFHRWSGFPVVKHC